ncbi:MAG: tRNA 4-thiouridine(8) synthase ThiI [Lachnospiraceae bacterium]|nr:tRNA 4-thiouridine(8) synthase ThiI [Lachnospiraceae bacterium]
MGKEKRKYKAFLIKYAEIGVKGKNRYIFEDRLCDQIRYALKRCDGDFEVTKTQGRIYATANSEFDFDEVVENLKTVFGISGICPVVQVEDEGFEKLCEDVVNYIDKAYTDKSFTFKVETRRARKNYPKESMEINCDIGEVLLKAFPQMKVDVHKPDVMLHIEIREKINIYSTIIPGPGGLPIGTNGKGMLLLSGGIDSPVAGYMISKRGVKLDAVYFNAPPYTSDRAKEKVIDLARLVSKYSGPINLHVINFTDIQLYIYEKCPHDELTIIMRRYMMRIAEQIAKDNNCLGLITGESIGQVASQTMQSLMATNDVCTMPVYRPLIGFDKQEIVEVSEKINTYETSILPYEDCCTIFVAKHPVTKPNLNVIRIHERNLDEKIDELVKTALETDEVIEISAE